MQNFARYSPLCSGVLRGRRSGFTVIEVILVIVVIGIFLTFAAMNLDGMTPKYRLRTAVRNLGARLEEHRIRAVSRGVWLGVRYVFDGRKSDRTYFELIRPPPATYPHQPLRDREAYAPQMFPVGVELESVQIRGSGEVIGSGAIMIPFSPNGTSGSHIVTLRNLRGMKWVMKLNSITGTVDYSTNELDFEDFDG